MRLGRIDFAADITRDLFLFLAEDFLKKRL